MALVDGNYKFIMADVGAYGSNNDAGIFATSHMGQQILFNKNLFPADEVLPGTDTTTPCTIVADAAFPLRRNIMKPLPCSENANLCNLEWIYNF